MNASVAQANMFMEDLVGDIVKWHDTEWPSPDGTPAELPRICMKRSEEVGELDGALVKHLQGRTDKDWLAEAHKEFGDVLITLVMTHDRMTLLEEAAGMSPSTFLERLLDRWEGPPGSAGEGVRDRRGASYRASTPSPAG